MHKDLQTPCEGLRAKQGHQFGLQRQFVQRRAARLRPIAQNTVLKFQQLHDVDGDAGQIANLFQLSLDQKAFARKEDFPEPVINFAGRKTGLGFQQARVSVAR